jgi:hypothetical protein
MQPASLAVVRLQRRAATAPHIEPVRFGVPFAPGVVRAAEDVGLSTLAGRTLPSQAAALAHWRDGSVQWALLDTLLESGATHEEELVMHVGPGAAPARPALEARLDATGCRIDTGAARIAVRRDPLGPLLELRSVHVPDHPVEAAVRLEDAHGQPGTAQLTALEVEVAGPLRLTLAGRGMFGGAHRAAGCRCTIRVTVFAGTALVRLDVTLHNPRRARHRGGTWDLGDPGSILLRSVAVAVRSALPMARVGWRITPDAPAQTSCSGHIEIYQASSGGARWDYRTHVDRTGRLPLPFRGCRITDGGSESRLDRAQPVVWQVTPRVRLSAAAARFWQQFPSALEAGPDGLVVGIMPRQAGAPFELQGGERKTYTVYLLVGRDDDADLAWVHDPLVACLPPGYVADTGAVAHLVPADRDPHADYLRLVGEALDGPHSFFAKREAIDEYGWRNFGDTWADHEDLHFDGPHPVVSHYNNQYDLLRGFLLHFLRTADPRWFELGADLARHVVDIDLYHTSEDKPAYSGGPFWHTAHYDDAGRATHRSYSADSPHARRGEPFGGGPSCETAYTGGLRLFHYLSGDADARAAVVQLADWVRCMDDGLGSLLAHLDSGPTGLASYTRSFDYHGPGRGAGNSLDALIDAYALTGESPYLAKAEELITRCIHPRDEPADRGLADAESRWSYTMFLQALGRYLDLREAMGERGPLFAYARASLTRYAQWMLEHETPFMTRLEQLDYPTESWPAQDVRKSCVFDYAAQYGPPAQRDACLAQAARFFEASVGGVMTFASRACTRPLAVLLSNGIQRAAFRLHPPPPCSAGELDDHAHDVVPPSHFRSQRDRLRTQLATPAGWLRLLRAAMRPSVLWRVATWRIW